MDVNLSELAEKKAIIHENNFINSSAMQPLTPILFGAAAFQYLNAACELGLFEFLNSQSKATKSEIATALNLQSRAIDILLLGVTSLHLTENNDGWYSNSKLIKNLFIEESWDLLKHVVAFEQHIVYKAQVDFIDSLKENRNIGIRHIPGTGRDLYHRLTENPDLEKIFYNYMHSWTKLSNPSLFKHIDFNSVKRIVDVGGGTGINSIALAQAYPHLEITILEIPGVADITQNNIKIAGLADRIKVHAGDMFKDDYPSNHDCILFSHQLVIWTPEENISLLKRAYQALPNNGQVIIFNSMSNDEGNGPLMSALYSVYFASLPAEGGMMYAWQQYEAWLKEAGFKQINRYKCDAWTPHGIIQAYK